MTFTWTRLTGLTTNETRYEDGWVYCVTTYFAGGETDILCGKVSHPVWAQTSRFWSLPSCMTRDEDWMNAKQGAIGV